MQPPEPVARQFEPHHSRPDPGVAYAHNSQPGDVIEWAGGVTWRWNGEEWRQLEPGDLCRNPRDGSSMVWSGDRFTPWMVSPDRVNQLARLLDPDAYALDMDALEPHIRQQLQRRRSGLEYMAQRAISHGWVNALDRPVATPAAYHVTSLDFQVGDPVDITWSNGITSHHQVVDLDDLSIPVLASIDPPRLGQVRPDYE